MLRYMPPMSPQQRAQLGAIFGQQGMAHPKYSCPICREPASSRPVEAFALKSLVRIVGKAQGEDSPKKPPAKGKGKRAMRAAPEEGPWDRFFRKL
jgi:hypothetical protein